MDDVAVLGGAVATALVTRAGKSPPKVGLIPARIDCADATKPIKRGDQIENPGAPTN